MAWELVNSIVRNLGKGWRLDAAALQDSGEYRGLASGPDDMQLFFIARSEKLDPCMEHICPPLGWLRVDGRLPFNENSLGGKLSLELQETLTAAEMAKDIRVRLLPIYGDFLSSIRQRQAGVSKVSGVSGGVLSEMLPRIGRGLFAILLVISLIGLWVYLGRTATGLVAKLWGSERVPFLIENSPTILVLALLIAAGVASQIKRKKS